MKNATRFPWEDQGEKLVLDTPEQTRLEYRIAPFGTRFAAALIDNLMLLGLVLAFTLALIIVLAAAGQGEAAGNTALVMTMLFNFLLKPAYFTWKEVSTGQTWGKRRMGLRTVAADGRGVTMGPALIRNLARIVDEIPIMWLVPAFAVGKRRMGDLLAGTYVTLTEQDAPPVSQVSWLDRLAPSYDELQERVFYFSAETAAKLFRDDLNLLEYMGERVDRVPRRRRRKILREAAEKYIERLGLEEQREEARRDPQRFLRELGLFLRARFERELY